MTGIRIYGEAGCGSVPQVTSGLMRACEQLGLFAGFWDCRCHNPESVAEGSTSSVAICCGDPNYLQLTHSVGHHARRWFMFAPNSEGVPPSFARELLGPAPVGDARLIDGLLAPSQWARGVLERCFEDRPVVCAPHGVSAAFKVNDPNRDSVADAYRAGEFYVMHVTSTGTRRKATEELLGAWSDLRDGGWEDAKLLILSHPLFATRYERMAEGVGLGENDGVAVRAGWGLPVEGVAESYSHAHVICQPSRCEGFGMVPLEGRACGVPIVATGCTGHAQWMPDTLEQCTAAGIVRVPHWPDEASDDFPGARAPGVSRAEIAASLMGARTRWEELSAASRRSAEQVQRDWAWERVTEAALRHILSDAERAT